MKNIRKTCKLGVGCIFSGAGWRLIAWTTTLALTLFFISWLILLYQEKTFCAPLWKHLICYFYTLDLSVKERIRKKKINNYIHEYFKEKRELSTVIPGNQTLDEMWNGLSLSYQYSNIYFVNSVNTTVRSFNMDKNEFNKVKLTDSLVELLARLEHKRFNMEKLLMRYRMKNPEETELIRKDILEKGEKSLLKDNYRKKVFALYGISLYFGLQSDGSGNTSDYDRG